MRVYGIGKEKKGVRRVKTDEYIGKGRERWKREKEEK